VLLYCQQQAVNLLPEVVNREMPRQQQQFSAVCCSSLQLPAAAGVGNSSLS